MSLQWQNSVLAVSAGCRLAGKKINRKHLVSPVAFFSAAFVNTFAS